jgi:hypothetical protein
MVALAALCLFDYTVYESESFDPLFPNIGLKPLLALLSFNCYFLSKGIEDSWLTVIAYYTTVSEFLF